MGKTMYGHTGGGKKGGWFDTLISESSGMGKLQETIITVNHSLMTTTKLFEELGNAVTIARNQFSTTILQGTDVGAGTGGTSTLADLMKTAAASKEDKWVAVLGAGLEAIKTKLSDTLQSQIVKPLKDTFYGRTAKRVAGGVEKVKGVGGHIKALAVSVGTSLKTAFTQNKLTKTLGKANKGFKSFVSGLKTAKTNIMPIISVLDKMGVLEPIMAVLSPILEIIGGSVMEALMPALEVLIDAITDPVFMDMLTEIGMIIGEILSPIIMLFAEILMMLMPVILVLAEVFAAILIPIIEAFMPVIKALGPVFDSLIPVFEALMPIIKIVAEILGKVLAVAFVVIANIIIGIVNIILMIFNVFSWLFGQAQIPLVSFVTMPSYETGGIVDETGPAYLHAGEEVISKKDRSSGDINITIDGNIYNKGIVDEMIEELQTRKALGLI